MPRVTSIKAPGWATIDTATLAMLFRSEIGVVLVDARGEGQSVLIPGARALAVDSDASRVESVIGSRDTLIVTYCGGLHCPASAKLYRHLKQLGYENVLEYADGLAGWTAAGYPAEAA